MSHAVQVLSPRCEVGSSVKRKLKKTKGDAVSCGKKRSGRLDSLGDVEKALSESKDSASAVS